MHFCHGAPGSDEIPITRLTPDERLCELVAGVEEDVVVCGHTHAQFDRVVDGTRILSCGSVGAPYEVDSAAYWALLGADVDFRRTEYDVEAAVGAFLASGYPKVKEIQSYLSPDPERPARMSALIEGVPYPSK